MGAFWKDRDTDDLVLNYNVIEWGLREQVHTLAREFDGIHYVVPIIHSTRNYEQMTKPGMLAAKESIEAILAERLDGEPIPKLDLQMMCEEEADWRQLGWINYKAVKRLGLDFAEESHLR